METVSLEALFDLRGRTVVLTGGGRGIGRALADGLAAAGATLVLVGRDSKTLDRAASELTKQYAAKVHCFPSDLSRRNAVRALSAEVLSRLGHVDVFVHNAGFEGLEPIEKITEPNLNAVLETNFIAAALLSQAFIPTMRKKGWGRLVFLTSATTSASSIEGHSIYTASKSALEGFARTLAVELGRSGITANCISPGTYLTDQATGVLKSLGEAQGKQVYKAFADMSAIGRWGDPREMIGLTLLLCSNASSYITGETIRVDGGLAIKLRPS